MVGQGEGACEPLCIAWETRMVQVLHLTSLSFEAFSSALRASPLWRTYQQEVVRHPYVTLEEAQALMLAALAAVQCRWETLGDEPLVAFRTILHYKVLSTVSERTPGPDRPVAPQAGPHTSALVDSVGTITRERRPREY